MPDVLDSILREHRTITEVLNVLEAQIDLFEQTAQPDYDLIREIIDYFLTYPDLYHHPKEDMIFRRIKKRLPDQVEDSVLWLKIDDELARENLRREASQRGVNDDRIIFAEWAESLEDHLARHRLADLFLDTLHHNAHATANNALWSGLPVITRTGDGFASRAAEIPYEESASLLAR